LYAVLYERLRGAEPGGFTGQCSDVVSPFRKGSDGPPTANRS